ncbi:MAG: hypothetical protein WCI04_06475, partial [archaeon]
MNEKIDKIEKSKVSQKPTQYLEVFKSLIKKVSSASIIENKLIKGAELRNKEVEKHKNNSLKISVFLGLFTLLFSGVITKN